VTIDKKRLNRMLNPKVVVVVGDKGPEYRWLSQLSEFTGQAYSVQLDEKEIPGIEAKGFQNFKSLMDIPGEVDLVICAVPRQIAPYIVADAVKKKVGGIQLYTSGFIETGEELGAQLQGKIATMALEANMPLVGPNCLGVYNRHLGVKFAGEQEQGEGGDVSIISQSGTHGTSLSIGAQRYNVKVRRGVSIGNAAVLVEADYLDYLKNDPETPAIAMYLEGIRDGRRFAKLLRETTPKKPVVIWRGGRTRAGARAVKSHTASLASNDAIWSALMKQSGAISADSQEEAVDVMQALVHSPRNSKRNVALIAMTGGQSVAITDQFEKAGFEVPELSAKSYKRLSEFFNTIGGSYRNPFDAASTIGREADNLAKILDVLADDRAIDGGCAIELGVRNVDKGTEQLDAMLDVMRKYRDKTKLPVLALMPEGSAMGGAAEGLVTARTHVARAGFPVYPSFSRGAAALGRVATYWAWRDEIRSRK